MTHPQVTKLLPPQVFESLLLDAQPGVALRLGVHLSGKAQAGPKGVPGDSLQDPGGGGGWGVQVGTAVSGV